MKKFIFSAVALMAFSFAGMANEIEEKEESMRFIDACAIVATIATHVANEEHSNATGNDWDSWTVDFVYNTYYSQCIGN